MQSTISIIICTRNKAESLRDTLRSVSAVDIPAGLSAEVIVADNGSTDQTPAVVSEFAESQQKFSVRHLSVPTPGQSRARNAGLAAASGDIVMFTDDDVRPPANWVEGMCRPILSGDADAATGSTRIAPHLLRDWMEPIHFAFLASPTPPVAGSPIKNGARLLGANMAIGRRALGAVTAFDERLGPGALGFCDDSLFGSQIVAAGLRIVGVAGSDPEHHFDAGRLSRMAFLDRAAKQGRCEAYIGYHWLHEDLPHGRLRLAKRWLRLQHTRAIRLGHWPHPEGAPEWELQLVSDIHRLRQYIRERGTPRRYKSPRDLRLAEISET